MIGCERVRDGGEGGNDTNSSAGCSSSITRTSIHHVTFDE